MTVAILLTCFNRREHTIECLRRVFEQTSRDFEHLVILVDDNSTDGTSEAVARKYPTVRILKGNGFLYWCGGMRKAWTEATQSDPDYYLLLNDDTLLYPDAIASLIQMAGNPQSQVIAVASICDPITNEPTYGGRRNDRLLPPTGRIETCETFNANCVLIPRAVYQKQGILHHRYSHGMGDFDYGFQAVRNGVTIIQSPDFLGTCRHNPPNGDWRDRSLSRRERWKLLNSPKGLPFLEWIEFNRRNAGWKWLIRSVSPWIRILIKK